MKMNYFCNKYYNM